MGMNPGDLPAYPDGLHALGSELFSFSLAHKKKTGSEDEQDGEKVDRTDEKNRVPKKAFRNDVNQHICGRIQHP